MKVEGCICIDGGTVKQVIDFLKKFSYVSEICSVHASNNKIVVDINYTQG